MGKRQTLLQRRYTKSQQIHEKMLNITSHQENANQNHNETPLHTSMAIIKNKWKTTSGDVEIGRNVKWYSCCGKQFGGSSKVKQRITRGPSNSTPRYIPKRIENRCSNKYLYTNAHNSTIHNHQRVKTIQISVNL